MKKIIATVFLFLLISCTNLFAGTYEASSLFNSVQRSETVLDLFFERWDTILDRQLYLDLYAKINWVNGFSVKSFEAGQKKNIPMTLVRTYGSLTVNYPILGGYDNADFEKRLAAGSSGKNQPKKEDETEAESSPLWQPKNLQIAFTMTGFHYGLTRSVDINRGQAGSTSATDYKFTQFFDDIYALSLVYLPYIYVHSGVIVNNQIEPNANGTINYSNSSNMTTRWFFASNLLSFLNTNTTATKNTLESLSVGIEINKLAGFFVKLPRYVPKLTVTYKMLNLYNDQSYDTVWVGSSKYNGTIDKTYDMPDSAREHAKLNTLNLTVKENLFDVVRAEAAVELQDATKTLIDKTTSQTLKLNPLREMRGAIGVNFLGMNSAQALLLNVGISRYWDPAVSLQRSHGSSNTIYGGFTSLQYQHPLAGAELKVAYNYSQELRKLIETADKWMFEGSLYFRF